MSMKLTNQGLSSREEFKELIESIGFSHVNMYSFYKGFKIEFYFHIDEYYFYDGSNWLFYDYSDLTPINKYFKKELRSFKLKALLR